MPSNKPKPTKPKAKVVRVSAAERIADRLFDSSPGPRCERLAQMVPGPYGQMDWGGWGRESVIRIISEELQRGANQ